MEDLGPGERDVHDHWKLEVKDPLLASLFPAATRGLYEEDQRFADAFRRAPVSTRLSKRNQGLGYWLFETTLVYTIFKSWLPISETEWEVRYPEESWPTHKAADLVVFVDDTPRYVFEAKWWMTNSMNSEILNDIEKMRRWPRLDGRFMLTFWRSRRDPTIWRSDLDAVRRFCREHAIALTYVGAFHMDEVATRTPTATGSYFAVGIISV